MKLRGKGSGTERFKDAFLKDVNQNKINHSGLYVNITIEKIAFENSKSC